MARDATLTEQKLCDEVVIAGLRVDLEAIAEEGRGNIRQPAHREYFERHRDPDAFVLGGGPTHKPTDVVVIGRPVAAEHFGVVERVRVFAERGELVDQGVDALGLGRT
jgi:hypothetical protein